MARHRSTNAAALTSLVIAAVVFAASAFLVNSQSSSSLIFPVAESGDSNKSTAASAAVAR